MEAAKTGQGSKGGGRGAISQKQHSKFASTATRGQTDRHEHVATEFPLKFTNFERNKVVK